MAGKFKRGDIVRQVPNRLDGFVLQGDLFRFVRYGYDDGVTKFDECGYDFVVTLENLDGSRPRRKINGDMTGRCFHMHEDMLELDPFMTAAKKAKDAAEEK